MTKITNSWHGGRPGEENHIVVAAWRERDEAVDALQRCERLAERYRDSWEDASLRAEIAGKERDRLRNALRQIAEYDAFRGGPIAPVETPTTTAMRVLATAALSRKSEKP